MAKFLNLQFVFGSEFDRMCAWASEILSNDSMTSGAKVIHLNEAAMEELQKKKV